MEEDQELNHICKLCNKSFPCGRSLGGHMRSHVINSAETNQENPNKKKLPSFKNGENPKTTCKFQDSKENTFLHEKLCKQCGKGFLSSKALFGHMKCHSQKILERENSRTSQSDNEIGAPNRRKRSSSSARRIKRYKATTTTTSSSFSINANGSSSVSEIEQEQEEVALCLIMLSRDVGHWGGLNSVFDSSDNNSDFLEARTDILITKIEGKNPICNGGELVKFKKLRHGKFESIFMDSENSKSSEFGGSGIQRNWGKMNKSEVLVHGFHGTEKFNKSRLDEDFEKFGDGKFESIFLDSENSKSTEFGGFGIPKNGSKMNKSGIHENGFRGNEKLKKPRLDEEFKFAVGLGKNSRKESEIDQVELGSKKQKFLDLFDPQLGVNYSKKLASNSHDLRRFECHTCNKAFHSFQALGGHRASHKKLNGCFSSKIDGSENSTGTDHGEKAEKSEGSKKNKGSHECPICFRVFSSGQALGGHKRSHLIGGGSEAKSSKTAILIQKTVPEIRDFLDLNMPAPVEEESSTADHDGFKPWWGGGSNHKHKPLVVCFQTDPDSDPDPSLPG